MIFTNIYVMSLIHNFTFILKNIERNNFTKKKNQLFIRPIEKFKFKQRNNNRTFKRSFE